MPRGTIDWKSTDSYTRLLAAMVAAQDMKLNYKKIADMYGEGATYDAIEGRFRIIKKEAAKLKNEIDSGIRPEAPPRGSNLSTPRKRPTKTDGVINGRVTKSSSISPSKRKSSHSFKQDLVDTSESSPINENTSLTSSDNGYTDDNSFTAFDSAISFENLSSMHSHASDHFLMQDLGDWEDEHVV